MSRMNWRILLVIALSLSTVPSYAAPSEELQVLIGKARSLEGRGRPDLAAQIWGRPISAIALLPVV